VNAQAFIGVDLGTTAAKAVALGIDGALLGESTVGYSTQRGDGGSAEQDPLHWLDAIECAVAQVLGADAVVPISVGICSQVNTHVLVDGQRVALAPAITWQDQRCAPIARRLNQTLGQEQVLEIWGGPFSIDASFSLCRHLWFEEHRPELADRATHLLSPKDYCVAALVDAVSTDPLSPVGLVGHDGSYNPSVLSLAPRFAERQAAIAAFDSCAGYSNGRLGLPAGLPVSVGTMDAWGGIFGSGAVRPGMSFQMSGTSEIVGTVGSASGSADGVISFPPVKGRFVHAGPTQAGGDALRWVADLLGMTISDALASSDRGGDRDQPLLFLPHLAGERAPVWSSEARGVFLGLTSQTESCDLLGAVLHGVAFQARRVMERCRSAVPEVVTAVRLSGGATESARWNQIKADVLDLPAEVVACRAAGAVGAALMGAAAHGEYGDLDGLADRLVAVAARVEPQPGPRRRLDDLYDQYCELYEALLVPFERLAATPD